MNRPPSSSARRRVAAACLFAAAVLPLAAHAQSNKPGLWEIQQQMQLDPAQQKQMDEARKQMAAMPPEQRKMMEDMMARQGVGVDLAGGGSKVKICIGKEDAAPIEKRADCAYDSQRSGATWKVKYRCTKPVSEGDIEVTTLSPERYTMKMRGTDAKGRAMAMQGEGKWLSADCGNLKPAGAAKP